MNTLVDVPPRWVIHIGWTLAELRMRFPGVLLWYGRHTGSLWSLVRDATGRDRLVEAADPAEMISILAYWEQQRAPVMVGGSGPVGWRNANGRHPDVLAAQRRERARIRSERRQRWGVHAPTPRDRTR